MLFLGVCNLKPVAVGMTYPHEAAARPAPVGFGKGLASEPIVGKSAQPTHLRNAPLVVTVTLSQAEAVLLLALYRQLSNLFDVPSFLAVHRPICAVVMALKSQHSAHFHCLDEQALSQTQFTVEGNHHV